MIFESIKCSKCSHVNPPHKSNCEQCKNHLRERYVNLDLWNTILLLIEEPKTAFRNIVYSEHKNFIFFLLFFISIKNLIIARFISVPELGLNNVTSPLVSSLLLSTIMTATLFVLIAIVFQILNKKNDVKIRFIDVFSISVYSFIPYLIGLLLVFPVQLIVLGSDIFSNNPYAFKIKPTISYILMGLELIMILWTIILFFKSVSIVYSKRITALLMVLIFAFLWFTFLFLASKLIFIL